MKYKLLVSVIAMAMASGCSSTGSKTEVATIGFNDSALSSTNKAISSIQKEAKQSVTSADRVWTDTPVLDTNKITLKAKLPSVFNKQVTIDEIFEVEIKDLLMRVNEVTGLFVDIEPDVIDKDALQNNADQISSSPLTSDSSGVTDSSMMIAPDLTVGTVDAYKMKISYSGKVSGLMTAIASKLNAQWSYDKDSKKVVIYKYIDKQFSIPNIPGKSTSSATISDNLSKAGFDSTLDIWGSLSKNLDTIVTKGDGGFYTVSESTGLLTVRTTPEAMKRVEALVSKIKKSLSSQVLVDVQIYSINIDDNENREVNFKALLESGGFGATLAGGAESTLTGATSFVLNSIKDSPNVGPGAAFTLKSKSSAMFNLLNTVGKTSSVYSVPVRTINNQPAAISASVDDAYLSKSEITTDSTTGVQSSSLTTEKTKTGLSLNVLPTIDANGRDLMLQVAFSLSSIQKYRTFETSDGSQSITPVINSRDFVDKIWLKSGQTLVMAGFDLNKASKSDASPLNSGAWYAGGSKNSSINKEKLVILITPRVYNAVTKNPL